MDSKLSTYLGYTTDRRDSKKHVLTSDDLKTYIHEKKDINFKLIT